MNIIKIHGFDLCSIGIPECPNEDYEEIIFLDKAKRYYKKCIIHQDRLVGAILIGDKSEFQEFRELIANKIELNEKRLQLLRSGKKAEPVLGKLVCSCNNVGSENLKNKINEGCTDFKQLCSIDRREELVAVHAGRKYKGYLKKHWRNATSTLLLK